MPCPRYDQAPVVPAEYAALLGFYLGDGCVSSGARCFALRVSCAAVPGIIADVTRLIEAVRPGRAVTQVKAPGAVFVKSFWKHWPCLFPQHGPGRKHERPIELAEWQRALVAFDTGASV